jgi:8-amino-7-oxononanoate synthase
MPTSKSLEERIRAHLASLHAEDLRRTPRAPSGIDLCSNDYLNLARHPDLAARLADAAAAEGCGSTGSRLLRGHRDCFDAVERRFAAFKNAEASLYFSAGYLANLAVLTTMAEAGDVVFVDRRDHASLIDGARLSRARMAVFPHNDVDRLSRLIASADEAVRFVVVESLYSMDGDEAPLAEYADLCRSTGAVLIVDEAHAVGVFGRRGSGLIEEAGVEREVCLSINTAGKALGVSGAFVAGPSWAIEYLVQRARPFLFSTAPPPALAAALEASLDVVQAEPERREKLLALSRYLRRRLRDAGIDVPAGTSQIVPVLIGDNAAALAVADCLQAAGFDVRAIRPPTVPRGTARLRLSVNVGLSEEVLDRLVSVLKEVLSTQRLTSRFANQPVSQPG